MGEGATLLEGVHHDSRLVEPGDLFVVRKGMRTEGARFLEQARERGARGFLMGHESLSRYMAFSESLHVPFPALIVKDVCRAMAHAASLVYDRPAEHLKVVGVTGTNGKTTTSHLIRHAIDHLCGYSCTGVIGTIGSSLGENFWPAVHTTPEADELARLMACMRVQGATYLAMEVTSIGLALERVWAIPFRVAAFTNLTQDHLDFHRDMEAYAAAKARLFWDYAPEQAVIHINDPFGAILAQRVSSPVVRVSSCLHLPSDRADIALLSFSEKTYSMDVQLKTPGGTLRMQPKLRGRHNLENMLIALGVVHALGFDLKEVAELFSKEIVIPGRLERCDEDGDDLSVFVDYAHTPDALSRVLESLSGLAAGRLICIFGCGGDRDATKRAQMGQVAARWSQCVLITSDNPRMEDPLAIAREIERGVLHGLFSPVDEDVFGREEGHYRIELDRAKAIDFAIAKAQSGDVILIAGKGAEKVQMIGYESHPFHDVQQARQALARRREKRGTLLKRRAKDGH
ncbi:UDP-N-acetylmuramoyl-L-alanyl-D-glutamate--2,6-diaminopimelate ligase [Pajaroellobacter abortibovis]|uniref:UDP-N-acetylmuramoyl-L-alanyl-D-glutamate--2,6-diaminopimelate ligase n=2 Tax=Pajaroellobacter abortibovis TaxID=1882918 RepID=A0A1L6MZ53_9BACT|nr:UDP-N-acetylmuramoyl-L-alanyl-D-glutamate--2,6-diaminopimelate ligase [Pajaroellobacter abortibovis]